jgi:serine/threonine-protein kinase Chk2
VKRQENQVANQVETLSRIVVVLKDLSTNGTLVNGTLVGLSQFRELEDGDSITIFDNLTFRFRAVPQDPLLRPVFDSKYTKGALLGAGHFARVFACRDKRSGREFAAKTLAADSVVSKAGALQLLMAIRHPNIIGLREVFETQAETIYILDLAPKGNLFDYIVSKQKLGEAEARPIFTQLLDAIKYLASFPRPGARTVPLSHQ